MAVKLSMNVKSRAKRGPTPVGPLVVLAGTAMALAGAATGADDGNLGQQLRMEQAKSAFQLMLEEVRESARLRAMEERGRAEARRDTSAPLESGDSSESVRLDVQRVTEPGFQDPEPAPARRLRADQAYERDQLRILAERQRRSALVSGGLRTGPAGTDGFADRRARMTRFKTQDRRLAVQRKLRR